jgi:hypothetical protein
MDYLSLPLKTRAAKRRANPVNFAHYPAAVGGIWTREGRDSRFNSTIGRQGGYAWIEAGEIGRFVGASDAILSRMRHKGWFVNHCQDETTRGVVYRLSRNRFLAGASDPHQCDKRGEGPWICDNEVFSDPENAARHADRVAELYAEFCREDDARQTAEIRIEEAQEEIKSIRVDIRQLVAGIRKSVLDPVICARLRADLRQLRTGSQEQWQAIRKLKANFWEAVE